MMIHSTHSEYDASLPAWSRARDVLAGEDAVKAAGEKYLPRLEGQNDDDYAAYKARASFLGATARTLGEYLDLIFRRAPTARLPDREAVRAFAEDCDRWGTSFVRYARQVVREVLAVGRAGSLVLGDDASGRPWVLFRRAEEILNWSVERVGGRSVLVGLVLREGERLRVLRLVGGECTQEIWGQVDGVWSVQEQCSLRREGATVPFIPFVFHGPRHCRPEPDGLPLADIIAANLDHYRLDADYKNGLHVAALPTVWVSGFNEGPGLQIGSSRAWVTEAPGATAGFLEFSGSGLGHLEQAMEKVERRMVSLGARMVERSEGTGEGTGAPGSSGGSSHLCGLGAIVGSLNESLSRVLRLAQWWVEGGDLARLPLFDVENDDF